MINKILYGKRGCGMEKEAVAYARKALCTGGGRDDCRCINCTTLLSAHPDYQIFDQDKYLADDVEKILTFANHTPVMSRCRAAVILNINGLSPVLQNKLLKDIEDNDTFFMAATAPEGLGDILPTIQSRTEAVIVRPLDKKDFLSTVNSPDAEFLYYMSQGCIGCIDDMREMKPVFEQVKTALETGRYQELFSVLGQVREKDRNSFYACHKEYVENLFFFMEQCLLSKYSAPGFLNPDAVLLSDTAITDVLQTIETERTRCMQASYGSNEFFLSVCHIVNKLKKSKKEMGNYENI